ncbi:hypothetical protein psyc5s11_24650 [Clostridium gelidum]|uniref:Uncharacterized protein n=1 Tax=Clostridium gelidum TaxID=704125 RepID=A0ABN6IYA4_9CLOT|nr:hypothetical protein [Clostridium gelidum]BCZ46398.1 hypothetical protein psyc5s11_24650 [Clostridium gelidum]
MECIDLYNKDVDRYKHGKLALKALKNNIQKEIGENINLIKLSEFVFDEELSEVAREIWSLK